MNWLNLAKKAWPFGAFVLATFAVIPPDWMRWWALFWILSSWLLDWLVDEARDIMNEAVKYAFKYPSVSRPARR